MHDRASIEKRSGLDLRPATGLDAGLIHAEMCALATWFVTHVAFSYDFTFDHHAEVASRPLDDILCDLTAMKFGAMCGALSLLMAGVARRAGYDAIELNFGGAQSEETHVMVLVTVADGERVFYDPMFGCFSGKADGAPASIAAIIETLREGRGDELRWINVGPRERPLLFRSDHAAPLPLISPVRKLDHSRSVAMIDLDFLAAVIWGAIWRWGRSKKPGISSVFDCLRFPLSTSGEPAAEEIAQQLRSIP